MTTIRASGPFSVTALRSGAPGFVLRSDSGVQIVISGYQGAPLPGIVTDPQVTARGAAGGPTRCALACAEGIFDFEARAVEHHVPLPGLFTASLAPYALKPRERLAARWLLGLMRWPGAARLLRAWHARRR